MACKILLLSKKREKVGVINFDSDQKEISLDWNQNYSPELLAAVTSILKNISAEKAVKARRDVAVERNDGTNTIVQKIEKILLDDPNFPAALTDRLNRSVELKSKIFAVLQKN